MARFLLSAVAALMVTTIAGPAAAVTADASVTVQATLTSKCQVKTVTGGPLTFSYTAFAAAQPADGAVTVTFECTRGLGAPDVQFNSDTDMAAGVTGADTTGSGVLAGLHYTISATRGSVTAGGAATTAGGGTAQEIVYSVNGTISGNQAGSDAGGVAVSHVRVLQLNY